MPDLQGCLPERDSRVAGSHRSLLEASTLTLEPGSVKGLPRRAVHVLYGPPVVRPIRCSEVTSATLL